MAATISYHDQRAIAKSVKALMGRRPGEVKLQNFCKNNGAPITNTDLADANGDICFDYDNDDLYIASNVGTATTTWTKFVG